MKLRMNTKLILCLALVLSGVIFPTMISKAQPVFVTYYSLEARVARAQSIFRGTISKCAGTFIERQGGFFGGYNKDGTKRPDGVMKYTITVQVDETLKGKSAKTIELVQETSADDKRFEQWADQHASFLFFIGDKEWSNLGGHNSQWSTIRLGKAVPSERDYTSDHPVYSMDFTRLTDTKAILARVRKSAKAPSDGRLKFHTLGQIPDSASFNCFLIVPVQPSLEKIAKHLIAAPEYFANWKDKRDFDLWWRWQLRCEGVDALRYFNSAANIKLLQSLLNDPDFELFRRKDQEKTFKQYPVRAKAYEVLMAWGVDVTKPVTEEIIPANQTKP
jgi:hypothetical protein